MHDGFHSFVYVISYSLIFEVRAFDLSSGTIPLKYDDGLKTI